MLTGKAKFGIFGDGKEVAQLAMANFLAVAEDAELGLAGEESHQSTHLFPVGLTALTSAWKPHANPTSITESAICRHILRAQAKAQ